MQIINFFQNNKLIIAVFIVAFLFSGGYALLAKIPLAVDAKAYDAIARNLVEGFGYKENRDLPYERDYALGRAGPGYEFFLAGVYTIFGYHRWPVWILQSFLHVFSGLFILLIYRFLSGQKEINWPVFLGLSLFLFHPDLVQINAMFLTESLFIFLLAFSSYLGLRLLSSAKPALIQIILLSILTSLAILVRPSAFLFFSVFLVVFLCKKYWKEALILTGTLLLIVGPWIARNYFRHGILFTNATGGLELWVSILPESAGEFQMNEEVSGYLEKNGLFRTAEKGMEEFKKFVFGHPLEYLLRQAEKTSIYFSVLRTSGFWPYLSGFKQLIIIFSSAIFNFFLLVLGFSGFYLLWKKREFLNKIFLLLAISMPLSVIPIVVTGRYRYPFLIFLAAAAIAFLHFFWEKRRFPKWAWLVLALFFLNSGLDIIWHFSKVISHLNTLV